LTLSSPSPNEARNLYREAVPTKPPSDVFDPERSKRQAKDLIDSALALLDEIRNYGLAAFKRSLVSSQGRAEDAVILFSYFGLLEMLDGVRVLIAEAAPVPARPILRTIFEQLLTLRWLTEADTERRTRAYLFVNMVRDRAFLEKCDPSSPAGRAFRKLLQSDPLAAGAPLPNSAQAASRVKRLDQLLADPRYDEVHREYDALKKTAKRRPEWYELFAGPRSIEQLAQRLGQTSHYEFVYRWLSRTSHAGDALLARIAAVKPETPQRATLHLRPLRDADQIFIVVEHAANMAVQANWAVLDHFRPGEQQSSRRTYLRDIKPLRDRFESAATEFEKQRRPPRTDR